MPVLIHHCVSICRMLSRERRCWWNKVSTAGREEGSKHTHGNSWDPAQRELLLSPQQHQSPWSPRLFAQLSRRPCSTWSPCAQSMEERGGSGVVELSGRSVSVDTSPYRYRLSYRLSTPASNTSVGFSSRTSDIETYRDIIESAISLHWWSVPISPFVIAVGANFAAS